VTCYLFYTALHTRLRSSKPAGRNMILHACMSRYIRVYPSKLQKI